MIFKSQAVKLLRLAMLMAIFSFLILAAKNSRAARPEPNREFSLLWFQDPPVEYRPLVRWWWPGNDVEDRELKREVDLLFGNYFGGVEVQVFDAGLDPRPGEQELAARRSFDADSYYQHLALVMEEANTKGMVVDLTLGSGWPSGGEHIKPEQSMKTLLWGEAVVKGPGRKAVAVPVPQKPALYKLSPILRLVAGEANIRWLPQDAELLTVLAAKELGGRRSKNPLNLTSSIELEPGSVQVLGNKLDAQGRISWQVPPGKWRIISIYICPDGQYLSLSALDPEKSMVADHFDAELFRNNLEHLAGERTGLQKFYGHPLRAFFNDSFELKTERFFTRDFLAEFSRRRGYDLTPLVPAALIPGADNYLFIDGGLRAQSAFHFSGDDRRVQYDYQLTVSDLFIERFIENAAGWAEECGLQSRVQAYGLNIDVIKAMGLSSIPATEQLYAGGYEAFLKMASSGAHLYHKPVVDAEAMVWLGKDYMTTPLKLKVSADKLFSSGINELNYHGFPYRKNGKYGAAGWDPFSSPFAGAGGFSDNFGEGNSFWKYLATLNRYIARCQYALRQGEPEADLLIYYPWFGFPASFDQADNNDELLFNGEFDGEPKAPKNALLAIGSKLFPMGADDRGQWRAKIRPLLKQLEDNGYTWDWVNDDSLKIARASNGKINLRGNEWKALLIFNDQAMPPETAANLSQLAQNGAALLVLGAPPTKQPGYKNFVEGDASVRAAMQKVLASSRSQNPDQDSLLAALKQTGVRPGVNYESGASPVRLLRRRIGPASQLVFSRNPEKSAADFSLTIEGGCQNPVWLDPWTGASYRAILDSAGALKAELPAYGSMILLCGLASEASDRRHYPSWPGERSLNREIEVKSWNLSVSGEDVEGHNFNANLEKLKDWRELKELKYCSSPGTYQSEFELAGWHPGQRAALDIGWVYGAAEVKLNGQDAGTLLVPPFELDVSSLVRPGFNQVQIILTPALRNRFAGRALAGDKACAQFKGREKDLVASGILGPAKIIWH